MRPAYLRGGLTECEVELSTTVKGLPVSQMGVSADFTGRKITVLNSPFGEVLPAPHRWIIGHRERPLYF